MALVSDRPHRPAMLPYYAMRKMLEDVRDGLFDATVVRGLLHTTSLFPVGSFVELDTGQVAKVVRANGPAYDQPILEVWPLGRRTETSEVFDLQKADVRIVKPLTGLP